MADLEGTDVWGDEDTLDAEVMAMSNDELSQRVRLLDNGGSAQSRAFTTCLRFP
jgi:hypothetical protein